MQTSFIGVDVSKSELVISVDDLPPLSVVNDVAHITRWLAKLPKDCCIAMESTGRYHLLLAQLALQAGLMVYVLNARDVYFYAKALGARAKSDALDCVVIRRYVQEHFQSLHPWQPGTKVQQQLHALLTRRAQVSAHQAAIKQTLKETPLPEDHLTQLMQSFKNLVGAMDRQVIDLIARDEVMQQGCVRLQTITGIGPQTGALLTELLSRLHFANSDALVAYSGLDPRANDSGTKKGRRRLSKRGPALLRRQMYLAAFAASHSKALKPLYTHIRAKGFSTTESMVILARKLLRVAFAIWKGQETFNPEQLLPNAA
ncbi:IS110-like element IS1663 family transposase [Comamonas piscis]